MFWKHIIRRRSLGFVLRKLKEMEIDDETQICHKNWQINNADYLCLPRLSAAKAGCFLSGLPPSFCRGLTQNLKII